MKQHRPPRAIALGYFDGVHMGHRALMERAVQRAREIGGTSAVFTLSLIHIYWLPPASLRKRRALTAARASKRIKNPADNPRLHIPPCSERDSAAFQNHAPRVSAARWKSFWR